jgi:hypothetical protein
VALFLRGRGYRAFALLGGFNAWRDAGLPLLPLTGPTSNGRVQTDQVETRDLR